MSFGLNISLWQFQLASSHHAEGRKCALEWLGLQLSSSTLPAVERSVFLVPHVCRPLSLLMFYTSFNWSSLIFFSRYHWFVLPFITLQHPPSCPPVCKSLISALVAVQMALCWCFTMGLRSVCLLPSTYSKLLHSSCLVALFAVRPSWFSSTHHRVNCYIVFFNKEEVIKPHM